MKTLLKMHADAQELLAHIPVQLDKDNSAQISRDIGAELEARVQTMHRTEKEDFIISELLEEIEEENNEEKSLKDLEQGLL